MKELLEFIIKSLVENKDKVEINEATKEDGTIVFSVKVDEQEMGKIIGKQGRIAKAIRTLTKAVSGKENKKVVIDIVD